MRKKTLAIAIAATSAALVAGSLGFTGTAKADPSAQRTFSAVGSNTTQNVIAALAGQTPVPAGTVTPPAGTLSNVGSYEATGTTPLTLNCNGTNRTFTRPNGSGQGVAALSASLQHATFMGAHVDDCFAFARSSGGPAAAGTDLIYVPFARDAVGYVYKFGSGVSAADKTKLANLTKANLTTLYQGSQVAGTTVTVTPYIPQSGSGTRAFFQTVIGVDNAHLGANVNQSASNEENTASVIGSVTVTGNTALVYPFSIGDYVGQNNGFAFNTGLSTVHLGNPDGVNPTVAGSGSNLGPNPTFFNAPSAYGRDVYNVFSNSRVTAFEGGATDALLSQFVVSTANPTPTINSTASKTIIQDFGFEAVTYSGLVTGGSSQAKTGPFTSIP
jgi:hypothetical protein